MIICWVFGQFVLTVIQDYVLVHDENRNSAGTFRSLRATAPGARAYVTCVGRSTPPHILICFSYVRSVFRNRYLSVYVRMLMSFLWAADHITRTPSTCTTPACV